MRFFQQPFHVVSLLTVVLTLVWVAGCEPTNKTDANKKDAAKTDAAEKGKHDDHGDDEHPHGPHEGELIELTSPSSDEEYHGEWLHDEGSGKVTVHILDGKAKDDVPIEAKEVTILITTKTADPEPFTLSAVNSSGDPPKASMFEIENKNLLTKLKMTDAKAKGAVEAELQVKINDAQYSGKIEFVEHDEHGHKH